MVTDETQRLFAKNRLNGVSFDVQAWSKLATLHASSSAAAKPPTSRDFQSTQTTLPGGGPRGIPQ